MKRLFVVLIIIAIAINCTSTKKDAPTPSNTNTPTGQAPVFTIPTGGFQFRILSDTTINLSQYVSDPQNDGWDLVSGSLSVDNGTVSYNNSTKELTYSAPTNTSLTSDVIRFTLSDTNGNTQSYNVNISLTTSPTNSDPDYGVGYTKFIYDGVSYVSAYGIGLGNATSDIKEFQNIDINLKFSLYSKIYHNTPSDQSSSTDVKYGSQTFTNMNPDFTVQSLVGQSLNINSSENMTFSDGTTIDNYTIGARITINGNTYYSVKNTDGPIQLYTEIMGNTYFPVKNVDNTYTYFYLTKTVDNGYMYLWVTKSDGSIVPYSDVNPYSSIVNDFTTYYYSPINIDDTYYVKYTKIVSEFIPESGGQIGNFILGEFNILLNNGKIITGTFKTGF